MHFIRSAAFTTYPLRIKIETGRLDVDSACLPDIGLTWLDPEA